MHKMENKAQLMQTLMEHMPTIRSFGVLKLGVFGSFARDEVTPNSDVDLFVEFIAERKTLKALLGLSQFLEDLLGRKVELVTPGALNPFTGKYILDEVQYVPFAA